MVAIWDDHEVQDNYAGGAPGGGLTPGKRWSAARRAAGYKAYFEAMPFFARAATASTAPSATGATST